MGVFARFFHAQKSEYAVHGMARIRQVQMGFFQAPSRPNGPPSSSSKGASGDSIERHDRTTNVPTWYSVPLSKIYQ